jgi:hypothetical protein
VPDLIPYALLSACIYFLFSLLFLFQFAHSLDRSGSVSTFLTHSLGMGSRVYFSKHLSNAKSFHYDIVIDSLIRLTKDAEIEKSRTPTHAHTNTHTHTQPSSHIRMRIYLCAVVHPMTPLIARNTYVVGGWRWLCFGLDHLFSPRSRKGYFLEKDVLRCRESAQKVNLLPNKKEIFLFCCK